MQHSFDVNIAQKHTVPVAIFLNNLAFWIKKNQANRKHFHDGRYWTYNSIEAYSELFPYWTPKQMRSVLDRLAESGLIIKGNYNPTPYDRTLWYALTDEGHALLGIPICPKGQMSNDAACEASESPEPALQAICPKGQIILPKKANQFAQKGEPIPDINTDLKTDIKSFCHNDQKEIKPVDKPKNTKKDWAVENSRRPEYVKNELKQTAQFWGAGHPTWERLYGGVANNIHSGKPLEPQGLITG